MVFFFGSISHVNCIFSIDVPLNNLINIIKKIFFIEFKLNFNPIKFIPLKIYIYIFLLKMSNKSRLTGTKTKFYKIE